MTEPKAKVYHDESDVKADVKKLLAKHGWLYWMPPANGFGTVNVDFNCLRAGVFLAVETKFGKREPTVNQKRYLNNVLLQDGFAFVVTDKTLPWFQGWLEAFDRACAAASKSEPVTADDGAYMLEAIRYMTEAIAK